MAKIFNFSRYFIVLLTCLCSCVYNVSVNDTPPELVRYGKDSVKIFIPDSVHEELTITPEPIREKTIEPVKISLKDISKKLQAIYTSYVGVRELTGHNDGKEVEMFLRSTGLPKGYPYCAAFVHYCLTTAGIPNTVTAYSPSALNKKNLIWYGKRFYKDPISGDVIVFYYSELKRIGHTGFYNKEINERVYESVEANTNEEGGREGQGVMVKKRSFKATFGISRHIPE